MPLLHNTLYACLSMGKTGYDANEFHLEREEIVTS